MTHSYRTTDMATGLGLRPRVNYTGRQRIIRNDRAPSPAGSTSHSSSSFVVTSSRTSGDHVTNNHHNGWSTPPTNNGWRESSDYRPAASGAASKTTTTAAAGTRSQQLGSGQTPCIVVSDFEDDDDDWPAAGRDDRASTRVRPPAVNGGRAPETTRTGSGGGVRDDRKRADAGRADDDDFLVRVQRELEDQSVFLKPEIDRLNRSTIGLTLETNGSRSPAWGVDGSGGGRGGVSPVEFVGAGSSFDAGTNSYVDTASGIPLFKAFVDVSEFHPSEVNVTVDKLTNKIVVEAERVSTGSSLGRTFTQRVQLPRFADDARMVARMNQRGILKLEVPLIFYFPPDEYTIDREGRARSFVYEVRDDPTDPSRQLMEILVNTGRDVGVDDLRVEVEEDANHLTISAERRTTVGGNRKPTRTIIKRYTLPPLADVDSITSHLGSDGRLTVLIPIHRKR